jgi:restriction system protein
MAIPKYDEIQFQALQVMKDGKARKPKDFIEPLAAIFNLSEVELSRDYDSGNKLIFRDRINWALSYLNMAGVVTKPKRGLYQINDQGRFLSADETLFRSYVSEKIKERVGTYQKQEPHKSEKSALSTNDMTPEEALFASYRGIKEAIFQEIIETILSKSAREFESIVVKLLQKMGYGGEIKDSGTVTQYTNDKGIDGVINEDVLGFGRVCIQAKKYAAGNLVGRDELQKFAGALMQAQSNKGVFITTSDFTKSAYEFVHTLNANIRIILISGKELASYIFEYNLGMQTEKAIEIKRLDSDFWDSLQDDPDSGYGK